MGEPERQHSIYLDSYQNESWVELFEEELSGHSSRATGWERDAEHGKHLNSNDREDVQEDVRTRRVSCSPVKKKSRAGPEPSSCRQYQR